MQTNDRNAGRLCLLQGRTESFGIDEVDRNGIHSFLDHVFKSLDLLVDVTLATADPQFEPVAPGGFLGSLNLSQMERMAQVNLHQPDNHLFALFRCGRCFGCGWCFGCGRCFGCGWLRRRSALLGHHSKHQQESYDSPQVPFH